MPGYFLSLAVLILKFTHTKTFKQMKKVLFVLALGAFAACGGGTTTEAGNDTAAKSAETTAPVTPAPDTATHTGDTTTHGDTSATK